MHYFKRNIGDYHKKAGRLSILEHGAYTLLLDACYDRERFPTLEEAVEWCWARTADEVSAVEFVLKKFFTLVDGVYVQARVQEEIDAYHAKAEKNKEIALAREASRKAKREQINNASSPDAHETCTSGHLTNNQEPITSNQEPNKTLVGIKPPTPDCPHQEIISLYNRILPELEQVIPERWGGTRMKNLQTRWRESEKHQSLKFWERFFTELRNHRWYMGDNPSGWRANLKWILERGNFDSLLEKFRSSARSAA